MPPEKAKKLFEEMHAVVDKGAEEAKSGNEPKAESAPQNEKEDTKSKAIGIANGLHLKASPPKDYLRKWEEESGR